MPDGKVLSGQYLGYHSTGCHVKNKHKKDLRNDSLQEKGHSGVFLSYSVKARRQFKIMFAFIRFMRTK